MLPIRNAAIGVYMRHAAGESIEDIATADGITVAKAQKLVAEGAHFEGQRRAMKLQDLREEGALRNEEFRLDLRNEAAPLVRQQILMLLRGKKKVTVTNSEGIVSIEEIDDVSLIIKGIDLYRKTVSLEEKPGVSMSAVIQNNIQQNNATHISTGTGGEVIDFESTIAKIRKRQMESRPGGNIIDTTPEEPEQ